MRGFALKDLLVVMVLIVLLALVAFVGLRSLNERALRLQCQRNLGEVGTALKNFAQAHDGNLPDCSDANPQFSGCAWPWDMSTNLFNELVHDGATTNSLYCPANPKMNDMFHRQFWKFQHNSLQIVSYGLLLNGIGQESPIYWRKNLQGTDGKLPMDTELAFDATVNMNNNFVHIQGINVDRSNHVRGTKPLGGNVLFEDGHVAWRNFKQMHPRIQTWPPANWFF